MVFDTEDSLIYGGLESMSQVMRTPLQHPVHKLGYNERKPPEGEGALSANAIVRALNCNGCDDSYKKYQEESMKLNVHSTDGKNFRIYISPVNRLELSYFQNRLCTFLAQMTEENTIEIILSSNVGGWWVIPTLSSVLTAMSECKGKIITHATSRCSFAETVVWMFGHERIVSIYGGLALEGVVDMVTGSSSYLGPIYECIFRRGVEIGLYSKEDMEHFLSSSVLKFYRHADVHK